MEGQTGWVHLYKFSWFFVCTIASIIYYVMSWVGDYAKEERAMPFEALAREQIEVLNGQTPTEVGSDFNITVEAKV